MAANTFARFSATIADELGTEASAVSHLHMDSATTVAATITAAQAWATALDAVTDGQITALRIQLVPAVPGGVKGAPVAGSRVEQTGLLNMGNGTTPYRYAEVIPAFADAKIASGKIDLADTDVAAFIALIVGAVAGGNYSNLAGQALTGLVDAVLSFRKRRKQLSRSSFER